MLCKRDLCRHVVSVRVSVTFVNSVKMNKHVIKIFAPSGSHTILSFSAPNGIAKLQREPN